MNPYLLPWQSLRTTHTPAICDSGYRAPESRANRGTTGSTTQNQPVHIRDPLASSLSVFAASAAGTQQ